MPLNYDDLPPVHLPPLDDMPAGVRAVVGVLSVGVSVASVIVSHALLRNFGDTIPAVAGVSCGLVLSAGVLLAGVLVCRAAARRRRERHRERVYRPADGRPPVVG